MRGEVTVVVVVVMDWWRGGGGAQSFRVVARRMTMSRGLTKNRPGWDSPVSKPISVGIGDEKLF